jgi:hypothetical protein
MAAACADIFSNRSYEKFDLMGVWRKIYSEAVLKDWTRKYMFSGLTAGFFGQISDKIEVVRLVQSSKLDF